MGIYWGDRWTLMVVCFGYADADKELLLTWLLRLMLYRTARLNSNGLRLGRARAGERGTVIARTQKSRIKSRQPCRHEGCMYARGLLL